MQGPPSIKQGLKENNRQIAERLNIFGGISGKGIVMDSRKLTQKGRAPSFKEIELMLSQHAQQRIAQRNLSPADVGFVIRYGQRFHRAGVVFFFLGHDDIPSDSKKSHSRLEGTTVLMHYKSRRVVTVYRNRDGLRGIKRKNDYAR